METAISRRKIQICSENISRRTSTFTFCCILLGFFLFWSKRFDTECKMHCMWKVIQDILDFFWNKWYSFKGLCLLKYKIYICIIKTAYDPDSWLFNDSIYVFMKCLYNARSDFESHLILQIRRKKTVGKLQKDSIDSTY